ncbi:transcriptional repressor [Streptomyces sp. MB09-02B]|uniref:Fur family transcriptional regulator n=1 Tax=Streptomyces sp. MB09-02B TaxID=3028667 RepID=UPI0029A4EBB0|nr:transcriptional repressor [Streptomyces sp. MB09-02B]MDX3645113.1 transcriptional repressor [Streptomyces sp. MB09-02B]
MNLPTARQRATWQSSAVVEALTKCHGFVSAQDLHTRVVAGGTHIGLSTVYRVLRDLEATGSVDVVQAGGGGRLFRPRPADGHRHYLICRRCGHSRPVDSQAVEEWAERVTADCDFAAVEHTVELTGVCSGCQSRPDSTG